MWHLQYLQWCIPMASNTRMCYMRGNDGTFVANSLLPLLPRLASKEDLVLLNFGLHSKGNGTLWGYIQELKTFAQAYDQLKEQLPQFIWRQTSVQHFANLIGDSHSRLCPVSHPTYLSGILARRNIFLNAMASPHSRTNVYLSAAIQFATLQQWPNLFISHYCFSVDRSDQVPPTQN